MNNMNSKKNVSLLVRIRFHCNGKGQVDGSAKEGKIKSENMSFKCLEGE